MPALFEFPPISCGPRSRFPDSKRAEYVYFRDGLDDPFVKLGDLELLDDRKVPRVEDLSYDSRIRLFVRRLETDKSESRYTVWHWETLSAKDVVLILNNENHRLHEAFMESFSSEVNHLIQSKFLKLPLNENRREVDRPHVLPDSSENVTVLLSVSPARNSKASGDVLLNLSRDCSGTDTAYLRNGLTRTLVLEDSSVVVPEFLRVIRDSNPSLIRICAHGGASYVQGFGRFDILNTGLDSTRSIVSSRVVHILACNTAKELGPWIIGQGAIAFLGYSADIVINSVDAEICSTLDHGIDRALVNGATIRQAADYFESIVRSEIERRILDPALFNTHHGLCKLYRTFRWGGDPDAKLSPST